MVVEGKQEEVMMVEQEEKEMKEDVMIGEVMFGKKRLKKVIDEIIKIEEVEEKEKSELKKEEMQEMEEKVMEVVEKEMRED